MAFDRKLLSGNVGSGSGAPVLFTYTGVVADLTDANVKTTNMKPGDIVIITAADGSAGAIAVVQSDYSVLSGALTLA